MLGLRVFIVLIVVAGVVSYIGDKVGRYIGRHRLSVFGMRPRFTAIVVTIISGILIAAITFTTFMVLSREARLALFGLEELRQKIFSLENVKNKLEKEVEVRRKGALLFRNKDVVLTTLIPEGLSREATSKKLKQIIGLLDLYLSNLGIKSEDSSQIYISKEKFEAAVQDLSGKDLDQVLLARVTRNVIFGEVVPIEFVNLPNRLVFSSGREIVRGEVSSGLTDPEIEKELQILLAQARLLAQKEGVIPDASGSMGSIPYAEIFSTVKEIKQKGGKVSVRIVANRPIYSIGPLNVSFSL
ncbi:MAG: DUF3084 domain-containing protein [Candidatus Saganbacteria bacterium]|nr:DUF3084 domain-containing protein [Candidatus Saganbacteria bacterium]